MSDDDFEPTPIADPLDSSSPAAALPESFTPDTFQAYGYGPGGQSDGGGLAGQEAAPEDNPSVLVRGSMGYYTPLDGSGPDGQSGADAQSGTDIFAGMVDDYGNVQGLNSPGTVYAPPSQDPSDSRYDDISGQLRQFSFDEDMGTPRELPDWANNQRFGPQENSPATDGDALDDLSREIYQGIPSAPPTTYGDGRRPWADDFLANYDQEKTWADPNNGPSAKVVYGKAGGDFAKEAAQTKNPDDLESCALRISRALDLAGGVNGRYAIPVNSDDHLYVGGSKLQSYDTANSNLQDKDHHAMLGYISRASELASYLQQTWGKPDISVQWDMQHDNVDTMKAKVDAIQASLGPGEAAVFARPNHAGVITPDYMDKWAEYPGDGAMNVWILRTKPH